MIKPDDEFMTMKEAAEWLKMGYRTLQRLVANRAIPYYKPGREIRFVKRELIRWLENAKVSA